MVMGTPPPEVTIPKYYAHAGEKGVIVWGTEAGGCLRDDASVEVQLTGRRKDFPRVRVKVKDLGG